MTTCLGQTSRCYQLLGLLWALVALVGAPLPIAGADEELAAFEAVAYVYDGHPAPTTPPTAPHGDALRIYDASLSVSRWHTATGRPGHAAKETAGAATRAAGRINPSEVRFSQSGASARFRDGGTIDDLAEGLRSGRVDPGDVPPIRLVQRGDDIFSLDNRRLEAFRRAGVDIPYRWATPEEAAAEAWKFTTRNSGQSIRIRGG